MCGTHWSVSSNQNHYIPSVVAECIIRSLLNTISPALAASTKYETLPQKALKLGFISATPRPDLAELLDKSVIYKINHERKKKHIYEINHFHCSGSEAGKNFEQHDLNSALWRQSDLLFSNKIVSVGTRQKDDVGGKGSAANLRLGTVSDFLRTDWNIYRNAWNAHNEFLK